MDLIFRLDKYIYILRGAGMGEGEEGAEWGG